MLTNTELACQTQKTKTGKRRMKNLKPFRNPVLKAEARSECFKTEGGYFRSYVRRQYHAH